jgi:hypothetical protein
VTAASESSQLKLTVSPFAKEGERITALVEGLNIPETVVELHTPDTVLISYPHRQIAGSGTFKNKITWTVEHAQAETATAVEINVSAGSLFQTGLCRVTK